MRTLLTPQAVTHAGMTLSSVIGDTVNGNNFSPAGSALLYVNNSSGSPVSITIRANAMLDGLALPNRTISVAPGATMLFGPFTNGLYTQPDGTVWVDFAATIAVAVMTVGS